MPNISVMPRGRIPGAADGNEEVTFPNCDTEMYKKLGRLIYDASKKRGDRPSFENGVKAMKASDNALAKSFGAMKINVVWDTDDTLNIVIPELKDESEFKNGGFDDYLVQLGLVTIRACKR